MKKIDWEAEIKKIEGLADIEDDDNSKIKREVVNDMLLIDDENDSKRRESLIRFIRTRRELDEIQ